MSSTFSSSLRLELPADGDQSGTWGQTINTNLGTLVEGAISGLTTVSVTSAAQALTAANGVADQARMSILRLTTTTAANFAVYAPPAPKQYIVWNTTAYAATIYNSTVMGNTTAAGAGATIPAGSKVHVLSDGTNFLTVDAAAFPYEVSLGTAGFSLGTPLAAWVDDKTVQVAHGSVSSGGEYALSVNQNAYRSASSVWRYQTTGQAASRYLQISGTHLWQTAPSGTAGAAISWTQSMELDTGGLRAVRVHNLGGATGSNSNNARNHFTGFNAGSAAVANGWIAAAFGDVSGNRAVVGQAGGEAIIGAHDGNLTSWAPLLIGATEVLFTGTGSRGGTAVNVATTGRFIAAADAVNSQDLPRLGQVQAMVASALPPGVIMDYGGEICPAGWLECDGASYSRDTFPGLYAAIGTLHGAANNSVFNVPDHRGRFKRARANGAATDPDRATRTAANPGGVTGDRVGTLQDGQIQGHNHINGITVFGNGDGVSPYGPAQLPSSATFHAGQAGGTTNSSLTSTTGGNQTNPINAYVMSIIKT